MCSCGRRTGSGLSPFAATLRIPATSRRSSSELSRHSAESTSSSGTPADRVEALEEAVELLFAPALRLVALCLPHLVQSAGGRILVFTSVAAREPSTHLALSNSVRPGVTSWAKTLSRELGPRGITVNCVAPGRIDTARLEQLYPEGPTEADLQEIPVGRWGTPQEFGDVACFLASDRARYVTGTTVVVDGGLSRGLF
jgi:3-oxoacyl-[acyl-carrier protein] reductase